uniref:Uncharacterized protein n=1 Tax=Romanomermis culicivorax TaxID=13658 RepID=A0A915LBA8_ROMCU
FLITKFNSYLKFADFHIQFIPDVLNFGIDHRHNHGASNQNEKAQTGRKPRCSFDAHVRICRQYYGKNKKKMN